MQLFQKNKDILDINLVNTAENKSSFVILAVNSFLFTFFFILAGVTNHALNHWQKEQYNRVTVEIPAACSAEDVNKIGKTLNHFQGVITWRKVQPEHLRTLVQPWIGSNINIQLPTLIDVDINHQLNEELLLEELRKIAAGIKIESYGQWQHVFDHFQFLLQGILVGILIILGLACIVMATLITKSLIATQRSTITTLIFLGASSRYISRAFQKYILRLSIYSGMWGASIAILTVFILRQLLNIVGLPLLILEFNSSVIFLIALLLPFFMAVMCSLVSKITVIHQTKNLLDHHSTV